jgi:hypothetical protein
MLDYLAWPAGHGKRKWFVKSHMRRELHQLTQTLRNVYRRFDKRRDWYDEQITDAETGEVVRDGDVHHPLSDHQGHGNAKPSRT